MECLKGLPMKGSLVITIKKGQLNMFSLNFLLQHILRTIVSQTCCPFFFLETKTILRKVPKDSLWLPTLEDFV